MSLWDCLDFYFSFPPTFPRKEKLTTRCSVCNLGPALSLRTTVLITTRPSGGLLGPREAGRWPQPGALDPFSPLPPPGWTHTVRQL